LLIWIATFLRLTTMLLNILISLVFLPLGILSETCDEQGFCFGTSLRSANGITRGECVQLCRLLLFSNILCFTLHGNSHKLLTLETLQVANIGYGILKVASAQHCCLVMTLLPPVHVIIVYMGRFTVQNFVMRRENARGCW